jgi:hypothetical protein
MKNKSKRLLAGEENKVRQGEWTTLALSTHPQKPEGTPELIQQGRKNKPSISVGCIIKDHFTKVQVVPWPGAPNLEGNHL